MNRGTLMPDVIAKLEEAIDFHDLRGLRPAPLEHIAVSLQGKVGVCSGSIGP